MFLALFRRDLFGGVHGWRGWKRSHISYNPTVIKLSSYILPKEGQKKKKKLRGTPLEFFWNQPFSTEISKFCYIKKYRYRLQFDTQFLILLTSLEFLKIVLINMVTISFQVSSILHKIMQYVQETIPSGFLFKKNSPEDVLWQNYILRKFVKFTVV